MRKGISIFIALLLIVSAILITKHLIDTKNKPKPQFHKIVKTVFTETVTNKNIPITITTKGNLIAKEKIELFSEVQGVLISSKKDFKPGTSFNKGDIIIKINSEEFYANLQAQKSILFNSLTAIMPDIRLDFPNEYQKWESYIQNFDINKPIKKLPLTITDKEKFFISGRGIISSYFNVKNLDVKLDKYTLRAPFNGILTEALVTPGSLIRPGQKLGEFINPAVYEIGVSVKSEYRDLLQVGKNVKVQNLEKTKTWNGKVVRINGKVDAATQTILAFVEVVGKDLKEGQYLEVLLQAKSEDSTYEVSRKLLIENEKLYVVKDSILDLINVNVIFKNKNSLIVKGLTDGTQLLSKPVPGAHPGMLVKIFNKNDKE